MTKFSDWLRRQPPPEEKRLAEAIRNAFATGEGQVAWKYLMEIYYFSICQENEALALAAHHGARALVQDLMEKIDLATNPNRYKIELKTEEED